ncbi:MAG: cysteine desulfurase [Pseudomonadales bacterium]|jgi:cysteine desulfurase|nr:cysteine desulfurase [Pseudomonadales bacterium]
MIYLDYSATTPIDSPVLERFALVAERNFFNPNASYSRGAEAKKIIDEATNKIANYLGIGSGELIFTSGASESNNLAIKGAVEKQLPKSRNQIIATKIEHPSIVGPLGFLQSKGCKIDFVNLTQDGKVDLEHLRFLLGDQTALVTICAVDSEVGTRQPIEEIGKILKDFPEIVFHTDMTQCLGKDIIDLTDVDLASFSAHKIYGFKGIGGLVKKEGVKITPLIHGGKSTTSYRSGTPQTELIDSIAAALGLVMPKINENKKYVDKLNQAIREKLTSYPNIFINSPVDALPHILNVSVISQNPGEIQKKLAEQNIYISTKTACASNKEISTSVLAVTNDEQRAKTSLRISLSHKTTEQEVMQFLKVFCV